MGILGALGDGFRRLLDFQGRSNRVQYWSFALIVLFPLGVVLQLVANGAQTAQPGNLLTTFVLLVLTSLLSLAVTIRRLHDRDLTGWFVLLSLIPLIGGVIVLVLTLLPGTDGPNRFGPAPGTSDESGAAAPQGNAFADFKTRAANRLRQEPQIASVSMGAADEIHYSLSDGHSGTLRLDNYWRRVGHDKASTDDVIEKLAQDVLSIQKSAVEEGVLLPVLRAGDPFMQVAEFKLEFLHRPFGGGLTIQVVEDFPETANRLQTTDLARFNDDANFVFHAAYQNLDRMAQNASVGRNGNVILALLDADYTSSLMLLPSFVDYVETTLGGEIIAMPAAGGFLGFARADDDKAIAELLTHAQKAYENDPRPLTMERFARRDGKWVALTQ